MGSERSDRGKSPARFDLRAATIELARVTAWLLTAWLGLSVAWAALAYPEAVATGALRWWTLPLLLDGVLRDAAMTTALTACASALPVARPWPAALTLLGLLVAQVTEVMAVRAAGGFLSTSDLRHIEHAAYALRPLETAAASAVVLVAAWLGARAFGAAKGRWHAAARVVLALLLLVTARSARDFEALRDERDRAIGQVGLVSGSPLRAFADTFVELWQGAPTAKQPSAEALRVAGRYGLQLRPEARCPTARDHIWQAPSQLARRAEAPAQPNVVILFVESLSARLLEPYGGQFPGLTPVLQRLAGRCSVVRGWQNHVTPTVTGLRGQLCSLYPALSYDPWAAAVVMPRSIRPTRCLPHLLADAGWRTMYWSHSRPEATWIRAQAHGWGFQDTLLHQEVLTRWLPSATIARPDYGPSDRQLLAAVGAFLRSDEAGKRPFALAVSTIETHIGTEPGPDWKRYPGRDLPILHGIHNLDAALQPIVDALAKGPRARDTVLIVTADHALYPSAAYRAVAPDIADSRFDEVAMMVCDPTHDWPRRLDWPTTSVDFAPTLAQLLQLRNEPVPWLGWSALGDRWRFEGAVGLIYGKHLLTTGRAGSRRGGEDEPAQAALVDAVRWTQQLEADGRGWPADPRARPTPEAKPR